LKKINFEELINKTEFPVEGSNISLIDNLEMYGPIKKNYFVEELSQLKDFYHDDFLS